MRPIELTADQLDRLPTTTNREMAEECGCTEPAMWLIRKRLGDKYRYRVRRQCPLCHSEFETSSPIQIYCSRICTDRSLKGGRDRLSLGTLAIANPVHETATCKRCGQSFSRLVSARPRSYCSDACRTRTGTPRAKRRRPKTEVTCSECSAAFVARTATQKQCSAKCRRRAKSRASRGSGTCPVCGIVFVRPHGSQIYCSARCRRKNEK